MTVPGRTAIAIVVGALLAYPLVTLAGGAPPFPTREDCARPASPGTPGEELEVVYGRLDEPVAAEELLRSLTNAGFVGAEIELDACARWKVAYPSLESFDQATALADQVRAQGFEARVELEG